MAEISQVEKAITPEEIVKIEKKINLKFPAEYKEHLLKYNGGQCTPNLFTFIENGTQTDSCIDWFLAIYDGEYDNLEQYIDIYKLDEKRLPIHIVPIAHDPGGNLICISCGSNDNGSVYFWDHESEVDYNTASDDDYSNLYLIADSFNNFLKNLK